jgi:hypothetical protein
MAAMGNEERAGNSASFVTKMGHKIGHSSPGRVSECGRHFSPHEVQDAANDDPLVSDEEIGRPAID